MSIFSEQPPGSSANCQLILSLYPNNLCTYAYISETILHALFAVTTSTVRTMTAKNAPHQHFRHDGKQTNNSQTGDFSKLCNTILCTHTHTKT